MNNYPYPVLTEFDSGYKEDVTFAITNIITANEKEGLIFKIDYELLSQSLKSKIDNNQAELFVKIESKIISKMEKYDAGKIEIKYEDLAENDKLNINLFILALDNCSINSNDDLLDIYGDNYSYNLRKNDVLAISNTETFYYNLSGNDFIKFVPDAKQDGCGFRINCDKSNYIQIIVGKNFNTAYGRIKGNINVRDIFNSHIIFETFAYILIGLAQDKERYIEKEWYQSFNQIIDSAGKDIDNIIASASDGEGINMEFIYKTAQELIDNNVEKTIIRVGEKEEIK